jgi:uncharacterized protein (TIGR03083 family)
MEISPLPPNFTAHLLRPLDAKLIALLRSLGPADWQRQTLAPLWKVKDVAAHLLDSNVRALSLLRDGHSGRPPGPVSSYGELLAYLDRLNDEWVRAFDRISPALLCDWLEMSGSAYCKLWEEADPYAPAPFAVAWAGESESLNGFHIAREYTEKWHHQQQIRFALGLEAELYAREWYYPYLDTSLRALPHHYRSVEAAEGCCIRFRVEGEGGGDWHLVRSGGEWQLSSSAPHAPDCALHIPGEIAWRIFTKGISPEESAPQIRIEGDPQLGMHVLSLRAVMA